ncbi:MAG: hypothetical protein ACHREM_18590 [Polyangiales bacterium]
MILPLVAFAELYAGRIQDKRVPSHEDWARGADAASRLARPDASTRYPIVVAPRWATPVGDMALGGFSALRPASEAVVDTHVTGRSSLETARHVVELSVAGADDPEIKGWKRSHEEHFGPLHVRVLDNPAPAKLLRDLSDEIDPSAKVMRVDPSGKESACRWETSGPQKILVVFSGPEIPIQRFLCPPYDTGWAFVAPTVITDLAYVPRRCIFMHPEGETKLRISLPPKPIGRRVVAWVGLPYEVERELTKGPVRARIQVAGETVAEVTHFEGDGWKRFEGDSSKFAGQSLPVTIETFVDDGNSGYRQACVAAELRE